MIQSNRNELVEVLAPRDKQLRAQIAPVQSLIAESKVDDAQALAIRIFDIESRVRALCLVTLARIQRSEHSRAAGLIEGIVALTAHAFPPVLELSELTWLLSSALDMTPPPSVLCGLVESVERAHFKVALALKHVAGWDQRERQQNEAELRGSFACLLEFQLVCDPQRAVQMLRGEHSHGRRAGLPALLSLPGRESPGREAIALLRLRDRGQLELVAEYLHGRLGDDELPDEAVYGYIEALGQLMLHRISAGRFEQAIEIVRAVSSRRKALVGHLGDQLSGKIGTLAAHDIDMAFNSLQFMGGTSLERAKVILNELVAARAVEGEGQLLERSSVHLGGAPVEQAVVRFLDDRKYDRAEELARDMVSPARDRYMYRVAIGRADLKMAARFLSSWFKFEGRSSSFRTVRDEFIAAVRALLSSAEAAGDWTTFEDLLGLANSSDSLSSSEHRDGLIRLERHTQAQLDRAIEAQCVEEVTQHWRRTQELQRQLGPFTGGSPVIAERAARWLMESAHFDAGLEIGRAIWTERVLMEYLIDAGTRSLAGGDVQRTTRFFEQAERLARRLVDFAALAVIGNQYTRLGDAGRGRVMQADARRLDEERRAEEQRRLEEDDD